MNRRELFELTRVRVLLFLREPEALFWVFVFPIVLAGVLGFAFRNAGIEPSTVGVLVTPGHEELLAAFERDEHIEVVRFEELEEARRKLIRGTVDVLVEPGVDGDTPGLSFDPQRNEAETARIRVLRALELHERDGQGAELVIEEIDEVGSRYLDFLFPGLLGMNLMGTGLWGIGFAIADIRRRKLLKRLLVTPMNKSSFFLSFILSRLVFLILEIVALVLIGTTLLGVPFRCGFLDFAVLSVSGAFAFAGIGVLVASRARTIEAVSGLMNLVMMPMWLGSGVFFSYEKFPAAVHPLLKLLPLTALNDALRALMLDGESLWSQGPELLIQLGWGVLAFLVALKIFRWE